MGLESDRVVRDDERISKVPNAQVCTDRRASVFPQLAADDRRESLRDLHDEALRRVDVELVSQQPRGPFRPERLAVLQTMTELHDASQLLSSFIYAAEENRLVATGELLLFESLCRNRRKHRAPIARTSQPRESAT